MSSTDSNLLSKSLRTLHSGSWYRNRNYKKLPRRKNLRRSHRLALIEKAKTFTHPPHCNSVATSQSSSDSHVTYRHTKDENKALRCVPSSAAFKEYVVNKFSHFRHVARIAGCRQLGRM